MAKTKLINKNLSAPEVGKLITEGKWNVRGATATVEITRKTRGAPITKIYQIALPMLSVDLVVDVEEEIPKKRGPKPQKAAKDPTPKKRGPKPKVATPDGEKPKKRRGRKPKAETTAAEPPKKRGPKPKVATTGEEKPKKRKPRIAVEPTVAPPEAVAEKPAKKEQASSSPWNTDPENGDYEF